VEIEEEGIGHTIQAVVLIAAMVAAGALLALEAVEVAVVLVAAQVAAEVALEALGDLEVVDP